MATPNRPGRITALDGLRGIAALIVLVHHSLLAMPAFAAPYFSALRPASALDAVVYSPIHLLWAGTEAVYVFFILSGVVLTLPVLRSTSFSWKAYYPSRLLRLYLPCLAALALAVLLAIAVPRTADTAKGAWGQLHVMEITPVRIVHAAILVDGTNALNTAFWSLQFEVLFSLLLPLYVVIVLRARRLWWVPVVGALAAVAIGVALGSTWLTFLPMFLIGCTMAARLDDLRAACARLPSSAWIIVLVLAVLLVTSAWTVGRLGDRAGIHLATVVPVVLGAGLFVVMAIGWPAAQRVLDSPTSRWLGRISFSLYLVHEPIVVSVAFLLPASAVWLVPFIAIPLSLAAGALFFRFVERPSHRLAHRVATALRPRRVEVRAS